MTTQIQRCRWAGRDRQPGSVQPQAGEVPVIGGATVKIGPLTKNFEGDNQIAVNLLRR